MHSVIVAAAMLAAMTVAAGQTRIVAPPFSVVEASIADLRRAMDDGRTTSRAITQQYLSRLERYNGTLRAAITINPNALVDADARDRERRERRRLGPLHGIPIAVKDNIHTLDMPTTGGALAFRHLRPPFEATLVRQLREAGAVIIAKTTLTELANWVSPDMPTGYNAILGYSSNPYQPARTRRGRFEVPVRLPGGSSSGIGTAASLWAANVGTETSGSILNPSGETMLVGIKPTVGRISRHGVIPITADQDTPGPMARTVADAATLLGVLEGAAPDPRDEATRRCTPPATRDYTRFLDARTLKGARIGVARATVVSRIGPGSMLLDAAVAAIRQAGAVVIDPADLPSLTTASRERNLADWPICFGTPGNAGCSIVLRYGMKRDFNRWLTSLGAAAPVRNLTELRRWNVEHEADGALEFGQGQLDASDAIDLERDGDRYRRDRDKDLQLTRTDGLDVVLRTHQLDAIVFPSYVGAAIGARAGYPSIIVPFTPQRSTSGTPPLPSGLTFTGAACSEPRLIALAYAFEQETRRRVPPTLE
jgi:amidase